MRVIFSTVTLLNVSGGTLACGVGEACARHKNVSLDCVMGVVGHVMHPSRERILKNSHSTKTHSLTHSTRKNVDPTNATNKPKSLFVKVNERNMEHGGRTMGTQHEPELRPKQSMLIISNRNIKLC